VTIPFDPTPTEPTPAINQLDGTVMGAALSGLSGRTEANVKSTLKSQLQNNNTSSWSTLWDQFKEQIKSPFTFDNVSTGGNILANPGFENSAFALVGANSPAYNTVSAYVLNGTRSCRLAGGGSSLVAKAYLYSNATTSIAIPCSQYEWFYLECYVKGDATNVQTSGGTGGVRIGVEWFNSSGTATYLNAGSLDATTALKAGWTKLSGYVQMPVGAVSYKPMVSLTTGVPVTEKYYFDQCVLKEHTWAQGIIDRVAQGIKGTNAPTGNTLQTISENLQDAWSNFWDGLMGSTGTTGKLPTDVKTAAGGVRSTANTASTNANTANTGVQGTVDGIFQGVFGGSSTGNSLTQIGANLQSGWAKLWDGLTGGSGSSAKLPGDVQTAAGSVRSTANTASTNANTANTSVQSTVDGIHQAVQGGSATGNGLTTIKTNLASVWNNLWDGLSGNASQTSSGKIFSDLFTAGGAARSRAELGVSNAATAQSSATTADGKAVTAQTNLQTTVDGIHQAVQGGAGTNNSFTSVKTNLASVWNNLWDGLSGNSTQASTGKIFSDLFTAGGAARSRAELGVSNAATAQSSATTADGKAVTAQTNLQTTVDGIHQAVQGGSSTNNGFTSVKTNLASVWNNLWDGLSGNASQTSSGKIFSDLFTAGGAARSRAELGVSNAATAQTAATTADGKAVAADGKAVVAQGLTSTLMLTGSNMLPNGSFENSSFFLQNVGGSYSTEQKNSGTQSAKVISNASSAYVYVTADTTATKPISGIVAGDVLYLEFWVYGKSTNVQTTGGTNAIQMVIGWQNSSLTSTGFAFLQRTASTALNNGWTKVSGYTTAAPAGTTNFRAYLELTGNVATGETYYFDDVVVQRVTEGYVADGKAATAQTNLQTTVDGIHQAVQGGAATNNGFTSVKTNLAAVWNNLWDGLSGTGSQTSTGKVVGDLFAAGSTARSRAETGITNAATADAKAVTADGKAVTADGKAVTADGKAVTAQTNIQTTVDGIHQAVQGGATTNNSFTSVKTNLASVWNNLWDGLSGTGSQTSTGKVVGDLFTAGSTARSRAETGITNAATAQSSATTADGKAVTAQTNLQTTVDGIHQAVQGGATTNNTFGSVKTNLASVWNNLWDGLSGTGSQTSTGKVVGDLFAAGSTARSRAETGITNAATADAKAVTADGKAVTADGKAVTAQNVINAVASSANLVISPNFEDSTITRIAYGSPTISYDTSQKFQGTRSLKFTTTAASWQGIYLAPTTTVYRYNVKVGDTFSVSLRIKPDANNNVTVGYVRLFMRWWNTTSSTLTDNGVSINNSAMSTNWQEMSVSASCPSGYDALDIFVIADPTTTVGNDYYIDAVSVREETVARAALADAATADGKAVTAQGAATTADGKAVTAQTNLQTTVDGIHQAVQGGAATNNGFTSVKTNLAAVWNNIWDGLNGTGSPTSSGKVVGDLYTASSTARSRAETGITNAATAQSAATTADGKAVTAQTAAATADGKAVTADGKAVTAQTTANKSIDYVQSGTNLVPDPGFENSSRDAERLALATAGGTYSHDSTAATKRSGTRSLKCVWTSGQPGMYFGPTLSLNETIPTKGGAVFRLSQYAYASTINGGTNKVGMYLYCTDSTGVNAGVFVGNDKTLPSEGVWHLHDVYLTVPTGYDRVRLYFASIRTGAVLNDTIWFDELSAYEVSEAIQAVDGIVQAVDGSTGTGNSPATAKTKLQSVWNSLWDGLNGTGTQTASGKVVGDLYTVGSTARSRAETGIANAATAQSAATTADGKAVTAQTNVQTTVDSIHQAVQGGTSTNNTFGSVKTNLASVWNNLWDGLNGSLTQTSTGKVVGDLYTIGSTARGRAETGISNAATAQSSANTVDTRVDSYVSGGSGNLCSNPGFEDSTQYLGDGTYATTPARIGSRSLKMIGDGTQNYAYLSTNKTAGVDVIGGGSRTYYIEYYVYGDAANTLTGTTSILGVGVWGYTTANVYVSAAVLYTTANAVGKSNWIQVSGTVTMATDSTIARLRPLVYMTTGVPAGNSFYFDSILIRDITEAATADAKAVTADGKAVTADGKAVTADGKAVAAQTAAATADGKAVTADGKAVAAQTAAATADGKAVTADGKAVAAQSSATTADGKAVTAQTSANRATSLAKDASLSGSNICTNAGFEDNNYWASATYFVTDQKRTGAQSLKMTGNGANQDYFIINDGTAQIGRIPASPGDVFQVEFWVYGGASNVGGGQIILYMTAYNNALGTLGSPAITYSPTTANNSVWTKVTGTITFPSNATYNGGTTATTMASVGARIRLASTVPLTDSYYFDDVIIREITSATAASAAAATADGKAVTADGKAVTADGKAVTAQTNLQTTVDGIHQAVNGGTAAGTFASVKTNLASVWNNLWDGLNGNLTQTATGKVVGDLFTVSGAARGRAELGVSNASNADTKAQNTLNNVAAAFSGADVIPADTLPAEALSAMQKAYETLGDHTQAINELQANKTNGSVKGAVYNVNFKNYADGAMPSDWTVTYSGAGTSTIGITGGLACWRTINNANRDAKIIYNFATNTDYQLLKGTMSSPPEQAKAGGTAPKFSAIGRISADGNSYVWARAYASGFLQFTGEMGYTLNGVETVWASGIPLTWSLDMTFKVGNGTNSRQYQVYSGSTLVKEWDETYVNGVSGTINESRSLMNGDWLVSRGAATAGTFTLTYDGVTTAAIAYNASAATVKAALNTARSTGGKAAVSFFVNATTNGWYIDTPDSTLAMTGTGTLTGGTLTLTQQTARKWGSIAQIRGGTSTYAISGKVGACSIADNPTPDVNGSVARMVRVSTSTTTYTGGSAETFIGNGFFDTVVHESLDVDANTADSTFTVVEGKPYIITARVLTGNVSAWGSLILQVYRSGSWQSMQYGNPIQTNDAEAAISGNWIQYLNAGEKVRLAYTRAGITTTSLTGESSGKKTFFAITGAG